MGHITLNDPIVGQPDSTEEPKIDTNFDTIANAINGNLDSTNLTSSLYNSLINIPTWITGNLLNNSAPCTVTYGIDHISGSGWTQVNANVAASPIKTVNHHLGVFASNVFLTPYQTAATNGNIVTLAGYTDTSNGNVSTTSFGVMATLSGIGQTVSAGSAPTVYFYWICIGPNVPSDRG